MNRKRPNTFEAINDPLDKLDDFRPRIVWSEVDTEPAKLAADETGFTPRTVKPNNSQDVSKSIDARTLRKTNRTAQLNISVSPKTKAQFWEYVFERGHENGEEALLNLLGSTSIRS